MRREVALVYTSSTVEGDEEFRQIQVRVRLPGVQVRAIGGDVPGG